MHALKWPVAMALCAILASGAAEAKKYKYVYTGTSYGSGTTGCLAGTAKHLTFTMVLSARLQPNSSQEITPLSWSFNDGVNSFHAAKNQGSTFFSAGTDANANIAGWDMNAETLTKPRNVLIAAHTSFNGDYFSEYVTDNKCKGGGYGQTTVIGIWTEP